MRHGGLALAALVAAAAQSEAAVFTQTVDFGRFVPSRFDQLTPEFGPLIEVQLDWTAEVTGTYSIFDPNIPPGPRAGPIEVSATGTYTILFGYPDSTTTEWSRTATRTSVFPPDTGLAFLTAGSTGQALLTGADLAPFIGNGIIDVGSLGRFDAITAHDDLGPLAVAEQAGGSTARGRITISYITGEVPEPASWGMMICGFGLVGAAMRRKRAGPVPCA